MNLQTTVCNFHHVSRKLGGQCTGGSTILLPGSFAGHATFFGCRDGEGSGRPTCPPSHSANRGCIGTPYGGPSRWLSRPLALRAADWLCRLVQEALGFPQPKIMALFPPTVDRRRHRAKPHCSRHIGPPKPLPKKLTFKVGICKCRP